MPRTIILSLAMSLDGYISTEDGGYDWIVGDGDTSLDTKEKWDYGEFLKNIDVVVMGKNCFDQGMHKDFPEKKVLVATSEKLKDFDKIKFISGNLIEVLGKEKLKKGKDIFIFGGGKLVENFLQESCIDEFIIGIIPVILGSGRKLFVGNNNQISLHLRQIMSEKGIVILRYTRRK